MDEKLRGQSMGNQLQMLVRQGDTLACMISDGLKS